ncbi:MAG: radical SAM protein [Candidatus Rhabdochlamydia sp.]
MTTKQGPWRITFDTNPDDCNLKCIMCEEHSIYSCCQQKRKDEKRPRRRMDIALIRKVLEESKGSPLKEIIPSTMGEPLLYRDFEEILNLCHEYGVKLNLTTNGTFPKFGGAKWAEKIIPVASDVKISWNGATKATSELIMIGSNFEHRIHHIKEFIAVRDRIKAEGGNVATITFQLTFMEIGLEEIPDVIRLAASLGVNRVKGHHLWVFTKEMETENLRRHEEAIFRWNAIAAQAMEVAEEVRLPDGSKVMLENIYPLASSAIHELVPQGKCPFLGKEAWVSSEGRFNPCCAPNEERLKLGDFGNLYDTSIETIWNSTPYQTLQANYLDHAVCKGCNMRKQTEELRDAKLKVSMAGV